MRIIAGHTNMDLDCLGSMVLARALYPGSRAVRSRLIHPVARTLYNLYADHLDLAALEDLPGETIDGIVVVDTRSMGRIAELVKALGVLPPLAIDVWDHHPDDSSDIPGAVIHEGTVGANTTLLGTEAMARGLTLCADDATIALAGIYADTGNFTHENVCAADFAVAGWLKGQGASLSIVRTILQTLKDGTQVTVFHDLLNRLTYQNIHGHFVITAYVEMDRQVGGLAAVVEKVFEVESPDALFAVFFFARENEALIVGRSAQRSVDVARLLATFGGGGHAQASSALVKGGPLARLAPAPAANAPGASPANALQSSPVNAPRASLGRQTLHALQACLKVMLGPADSAETFMSRDVVTILQSSTLQDASLLLESLDRTGAPVVDGEGRFTGYLTLRDVGKARRSAQMAATVGSHMTRKVTTVTPSTSLREIEGLFFSHAIYDLPVIDAGRIVGVVTREAFLKARSAQ